MDRAVLQYALCLLVAALGTAGVLTELLWLLGLAAWALIAAGLIEMIVGPEGRCPRVIIQALLVVVPVCASGVST
jgi:hypothetical protein